MSSATLERSASGENTSLIILISCVATIGGFLFGFDSGVINGTVDGLQQAFGSTKAGLGFEVASMLLGCAIGAFFAGRLADNWGRRSVLLISAVLFLLSSICSGAAHSSLVFVIARVIGGFAVGAASVMSPAYIAEVAPARYRGRLATVQQIAIISGLFAAFLSNYLLAKSAGASTEILWAGQVRFTAWWMVSTAGFRLAIDHAQVAGEFVMTCSPVDLSNHALLMMRWCPGCAPVRMPVWRLAC